MSQRRKIICWSAAILFCCTTCYGQSTDSLTNKLVNFPTKLFGRIQSKAANLDQQLTKQTERYLQRMAKKEQRLQKRLHAVDSNAAKNLFAGSAGQYSLLTSKLKNDTATGVVNARGAYLPYMDSLKTSLSFLQKNQQLLPSEGNAQDLQNKMQGASGELQQLQSRLQSTDEIKQLLQQRRDQVRQYLSQYTNLPGSITNAYKDYSKEFYYYSQQVREYKETLNDPDKMQKKALALLNKLPAFSDFMHNNSQLAALFGTPAGYGTAQSIAGLPTRDQVQQLIQGQLGTGLNTEGALDQSFSTARSAMDDLKSKLGKYGQGGGDVDFPDFKPNNQKTKTFLQRLEYGVNIQTQHSNYYFPTTTDIGLSLGYKLNDKNTIGVGVSYKLGWGNDIQHIVISGQGVSLRSYMDVKIKGNLYATGGLEYNYQQPFTGWLPPTAKGDPFSNWQKSGLIGLSKNVPVKNKFFSKTKLQLLWDFLSYQQVPKTQAFKFRVAYNFK